MDAEIDARAGGEAGFDLEGSAHALQRRVRLGFALFCSSRALESLALGWLACASTLACALLSRPQISGQPSAQAWAASSIAGLCAALSWWIEHAPERARFVRRVDARSNADGAVVTAVEAAQSRARGPLSAMLVARIAASVPSRVWTRAAAPRAIAVLAAPLLGLAIALAAIDAASSTSSSTSPAGSISAESALASAARSLRSAATHAGATPAGSAASGNASIEPDPRETRPFRPDAALRIAGDLDAAARDLASGTLNANASRENLDRLERELLTLANGVDPRSELGAAVATGLEATSIARSSLGLDDEPSRSSTGGSHLAEAGGGGAGSATGAHTTVTGSAPDGKMSGSSTPNSGAPDPRAITGSESGPESGLGAGRWWPSTYDGVVERWVETSRGARR